MKAPYSVSPVQTQPCSLFSMKRLIASASPVRAAAMALLLGAGLAATPTALAQATPTPPERMTYQGFLVDGNGNVLGSPAKNYDIIFRIYTEATAGSLLWGEQQTVTVDKGYFSVLLGEGASIGDPRPNLSTLFQGPTASDRFVAITVKGIGAGGANVNILPRLRLLSSPYAFLAQNANKLVRSDNNADLITSSGNAVSVNGNLSAGTITATSFNGSGTALTGVAKLAGGNTFSGNQIVNNALGIGGAPGYRFHVQDTGWPTAVIASSATTGTWTALGNTSVGGGYWQLISTGSGNGEGAGKLLIGNGAVPGGTAVRMTFANNGNVGIGTTDPATRLEVNGTLGISGNNVLEFGRGVAGKQIDAGKIGYGTFTGNALNIVGAGTTGLDRRVYVYAEGGMTVSGPLSASRFAGNGADITSINANNISSGTLPLARIPSGVVREDTGNGKTFEVVANYARLYHSSDKARTTTFFRWDTGLYIRLNGTHNHGSGERNAIYDGDSNWDFNSDRRLKKDIVDVEPMLERALQVPIRRYRWKDEESSSKHKLGVIAQEVQPLFPDLVTEMSDPESGDKTLTVGYSDFGLIAIKAIQEMKARHDSEVADLKKQVSEVNALKAELTDLKAQMAEVVRASAELRAQMEKSKVTASVER